jgi:hypothetical protein
MKAHDAKCLDQVALTIKVLQGKCTVQVLCTLLDGPVRLSQLRRLIPAASKKALTANLRSLEKLHLIVRRDLSSSFFMWSMKLLSSRAPLAMLVDVTSAVDYSTVNYKEGLAITGRAPIIRRFPLIPGIDLSGTVEASSYTGIEVGDKVVANGWGLSHVHHGGYAQKDRLSGERLVKFPAPLPNRGYDGNWNSR